MFYLIYSWSLSATITKLRSFLSILFLFCFVFLPKSSKELISNLMGHSSGGKHYAPLLKLPKFCFNNLSMCVFWRAISKLKADGEKNSLSETKL